MAGTIPLSMTQQFDVLGEPLAGGQLYLIAAGTVSTPQNGFQDLGLTIPLPNPIPLDAAGRIPQFFLADGLIKVRLQDKHGVVQLSSDGIQVIGPSSGGGGGGGGLVGDPTQLFQTGDMKFRFDVGVHPSSGASPGWVRANGLTIGSATASPSATERGSNDCQALFIHLWNKDATLIVSGGRGANASSDWTSNKTIATPDWRGCVLAALDDMGNTASGRLPLTWFPQALALGGIGGAPGMTITTAMLPAYTPSGTITNGGITTTISPNANILSSSGLVQVGGGGSFFSYNLNTLTATSTQAGSSFTGNAQGGASNSFPLIQATKVCTFYLKL